LKTLLVLVLVALSFSFAQVAKPVVDSRTFEYSTLVLDYESQQFYWVDKSGMVGPYTNLIDLGQVITGDLATFEDQALNQILNHAGAYNWELVTVLESDKRFRFMLKRTFE
jgi:hypothetical protein